ncbi:hypothetical protein [Nitrosomonas communis]|uniref:Uncharacterized protein n=1 Tax=Nitrosomonas communis TaxID=44574 RepID=A0A1I4URQ8_9PROT|nr:hypothetical protein [Nitrosomonas communis]SFM91595.1 hypothetical protein SAMN05421863_10698 [Nitrosomonas communis]
MNTTRQIPSSQNESWGFWHTLENQANKAWPLAMAAIAGATNQPFESLQLFLDSRFGRHFADDVLNQLNAGHTLPDAINAATQQWMTWKIGRQTSKDYGMPRGLPYLTGFVIHCEIVEESCIA